MEILKPEAEGQVTAGTAVAEPESVEMTYAEFEKRIVTDAKFADDYLSNRLKIEEVTPPAAEPEKAPETPPDTQAKAPEAKPDTPVTEEKKEASVEQTDDGKFIVDYGDGSKPQVYKTKGEAVKGLREKELYIRRQKDLIGELKAREEKLRKRVEDLEASSKKDPEKNPDETKQAEKPEEVPDLYDPEVMKKLNQRIITHENEIERLKAERAEDKKTAKQREEDSEKKAKFDADIRRQYEEATLFVNSPTHADLKPSRSLPEIDQEYRNFLEEIGTIAGTDGSPRQNLAMMDLYLDGTSEQGKKIREESEKIGLRPPEELDKYFRILHLIEEKRRLQKHDPVTGKMVPFTMEETYRYLQARDGVQAAPAATQTPPAPKADVKPAPNSPKAEAIRVAEERAKNVATDIPPGGATMPASVAEMTNEQMAAIMDTDTSVLRKDASRRTLYDAVFKHLKLDPPRLDGV